MIEEQEKVEVEPEMVELNEFQTIEKNIMLILQSMASLNKRLQMKKNSDESINRMETAVILEPFIVDEIEIKVLETSAGSAEVIAVENKAIYDGLKTCYSSINLRTKIVKLNFPADSDSISNMLKVFYAFLVDGINGLKSFKVGIECFIFDPGGMCLEFKDFLRLSYLYECWIFVFTSMDV
jgi:hypothetical protein